MPANRIQLQAALIKPYDRILFAKDVLSPVFGSSFSAGSSLVPASVQPNKSEQEVISTVSIYGSIKLEDNKEVTCYEIVLQPKVRIEQSKVAIQHYVRKLLTAGQAALVNFVPSPSTQEKDRARSIWRLTLVAKDSAITDSGVKEKLTHPKRYTYLLGPGETCKTAAERFETLSTEKEVSFQALVNAFSVEKLSKAFFDEYTLHYENFIEHLSKTAFKKSVFKGDDKAIRDFAKKLLGRIVFLYFVQKKGWMGASDTTYKDGMGDFMKSLFTSSGGDDTFYNNWLSVLFFETLNKERANDDFKMPNGKKVKVPFLNGGLFDREDHDEHVLTFKPKLFHNPDFEDAILTEKNRTNSRGFLDFLNAFNFTVHEDSPDDHTVAVDPEMLGHIFENLLEDNKDKGAFYTPKEIVHYMCQESLTEYLTTHLSKQYTVYRELGNAQIEFFGNETRQGQLKMMEQLGDKALNRDHVAHIVKHKDISQLTKEQLKQIDQLLSAVKICDPAIGSGAFPMGLLLEIYAIKEVIAYELKTAWKPAEVKENIIQNSIYGVDLEKGAVDIARLRFWLSLVVDEEKPRALPNLDYKIMQGNSLLESYEDIDLCVKVSDEKELFRDKNKFSIEDINQLKQLVLKYFNAGNSKLKKELQGKIETIVNKFINERINEKIKRNNDSLAETENQLLIVSRQKPKTISDGKKKDEAVKRLNSIIERQLAEGQRLSEIKSELIHIQATKINPYFLWHLWFSDILNLDKGGFDVVIANPPYVKARDSKEKQVRKRIEENFKTTYKMWDLYVPFLEKALMMLNSRGNVTMIIPDTIGRADYTTKIVDLIEKDFQLYRIDFFPESKIFENAAVKNKIVFISQKIANRNPTRIIRGKAFSDVKILSDATGIDKYHYEKNEIQIDSENTEELADICFVSYGLRLNSDKDDKGSKFKKDDLLSDVKTKVNSKKYTEGKYLDKYLIKKSLFLEWDTERCPARLVRPTFPELYQPKKLLLSRQKRIAAYSSDGHICDNTLS
ncbi:MAG: Eco57I restriction-modification methylase domain-containing protein [Cyclobacteriaceae bacterium]